MQRKVVHPEAHRIAATITKFVNIVFERRLGLSREVIDAVSDALDAGYSEDEIRIAFWTTRCASDSWLGDQIRDKAFGPEIVLRFKGGMNSRTAQPAKRWLDDCISRAPEMLPSLVTATLNQLPEEWRKEERTRLVRNFVQVEKEG